MSRKYMVISSTALALWMGGCDEHIEIVARERADAGGDAGDGDAGDGDGDAGDGDAGDGDAGDGDAGDGGAGDGDAGDGDAGDGDTGGTAGASSGGSSSIERPRLGAPVPVDELNDPNAKDQDPSLTADQNQIFFFSDRGGDSDIWTASRPSPDASWEAPTPVLELNSTETEQNPAISRDGLRIWFYSRRDPLGIYYAERPSRTEPFGAPVALPISGGPAPDGFPIGPSVDRSELRLAVSLGNGTSRDLYEVVRASPTGTWGEPAALSGVNSGEYAESTPFLIDEGREMLFHSGRSGAGDLFWAYRDAPGLPFTQLAPLSEINDPSAFESHPHLTADRGWIYFGSDRSGSTDIYVVEVLPD